MNVVDMFVMYSYLCIAFFSTVSSFYLEPLMEVMLKRGCRGLKVQFKLSLSPTVYIVVYIMYTRQYFDTLGVICISPCIRHMPTDKISLFIFIPMAI